MDIARRIFHQALAAVDLRAVMRARLQRAGTQLRVDGDVYDLARYRRVHVVAFGKAAYPMAETCLEILGLQASVTGVVSTPSEPPRPLPDLQMFTGGHPVPNEASFAAGRAILALLATCDEHSLVIFLLSGGGSALVELPLDSAITLEDMQALHHALVTCGAPIDDMNAVRKHLSAVKGGRLAAAASAATKITLGISDVPAGRESALASGPTLPDPTTCDDAYRVVTRYGLRAGLPAALRAAFAERTLRETPKPGDAAFARARFSLLLNDAHLARAAHTAAEGAGFLCAIDNSTDDWPLTRAADFLLARLTEMKAQNQSRPVARVAAGEVSSPVTGTGTGGRNSAFALYCVEKIAGQGIIVLSAGSDGADGNSPAAGAIAGGDSLARARAAGLDPADSFRRSDAYTFFAQLGDAVVTGPTGHNLRDLRLLLHF
jgi:hydroxypyruvate reductase